MLFKISQWLIWSLIVVSFLGFLDSVYLTVEHFLGDQLTCFLADGCNEVAFSNYAEIFGIPTALLGAFFYLTVFLLAVGYLNTGKEKLLKVLIILSSLGFLASLWLVYLQLFVIRAICSYCMVSAFTSTLIFICGIILVTRLLKNR